MDTTPTTAPHLTPTYRITNAEDPTGAVVHTDTCPATEGVRYMRARSDRAATFLQDGATEAGCCTPHVHRIPATGADHHMGPLGDLQALPRKPRRTDGLPSTKKHAQRTPLPPRGATSRHL